MFRRHIEQVFDFLPGRPVLVLAEVFRLEDAASQLIRLWRAGHAPGRAGAPRPADR